MSALDTEYNNLNNNICLKKGEHLLGVDVNNQIYMKPVSDLAGPWTLYKNNFALLSLIKLRDGTFLGVALNGGIYSKKTLAESDRWERFYNRGIVRNILPFYDMPDINGRLTKILGVNNAGNLYALTKNLDNNKWSNWAYIGLNKKIYSFNFTHNQDQLLLVTNSISGSRNNTIRISGLSGNNTISSNNISEPLFNAVNLTSIVQTSSLGFIGINYNDNKMYRISTLTSGTLASNNASLTIISPPPNANLKQYPRWKQITIVNL